MENSFTYGRSSDFNYAVARYANRTQGTWDACEVDGQLYRPLEFDDIPECDWDRVDALEQRAHEAEQKLCFADATNAIKRVMNAR